MENLEQYPPNQPNFGLVVALFAVTIVVILCVAYLFLHHAGTKVVPAKRTATQSLLLAPPAGVLNGTWTASV